MNAKDTSCPPPNTDVLSSSPMLHDHYKQEELFSIFYDI